MRWLKTILWCLTLLVVSFVLFIAWCGSLAVIWASWHGESIPGTVLTVSWIAFVILSVVMVLFVNDWPPFDKFNK